MPNTAARRARRHADDVGAGERVAGERWKIAPDRPNAAPTSSAGQGPRQPQLATMNCAASSPPPKIAGTTSASGIGKSPTRSTRQNSDEGHARARG